MANVNEEVVDSTINKKYIDPFKVYISRNIFLQFKTHNYRQYNNSL